MDMVNLIDRSLFLWLLVLILYILEDKGVTNIRGWWSKKFTKPPKHNHDSTVKAFEESRNILESLKAEDIGGNTSGKRP